MSHDVTVMGQSQAVGQRGLWLSLGSGSVCRNRKLIWPR